MPTTATTVLRALALVVVVLCGPLLALAGFDALRHRFAGTGLECTNCLDHVDPVATFRGRVAGHDGDTIEFKVDSLEAGEWSSGQEISGVEDDFVPWRRYRVTVYERDGHPYLSAFRPPETLGVALPAGVHSFDALALYDGLALVSIPLFAEAAYYLWSTSRKQSRREQRGVLVPGLHPQPGRQPHPGVRSSH